MDIYERIMRAAEKGKGIRLSPEDVSDLSRDDAISEAAGKWRMASAEAEERKWAEIRRQQHEIEKQPGYPPLNPPLKNSPWKRKKERLEKARQRIAREYQDRVDQKGGRPRPAKP